MKIYSKILGVINLIIVLAIIGFLGYNLVSEDVDDKSTILLLFIPTYFYLHFLIVNKFGFSFKQESNKKYDTLFLISSIISFAILLILPVNETLSYYKEKRLNTELSEECSEMKEWNEVNTAFGYLANLKTKYYDKKIEYQLHVRSSKPFNPRLKGFKIELLDKDGFYIQEIEINNYSTDVNKDDETYGISLSSDYFMSLRNYARIGRWDLLVTTKY